MAVLFFGRWVKNPRRKKKDPYEKDSVEMRLYSSKRWWVGGGDVGLKEVINVLVWYSLASSRNLSSAGRRRNWGGSFSISQWDRLRLTTTNPPLFFIFLFDI
jgi:hypothetical protein